VRTAVGSYVCAARARRPPARAPCSCGWAVPVGLLRVTDACPSALDNDARADGRKRRQRSKRMHVHSQLRLRQGVPRIWPSCEQGCLLHALYESPWLRIGCLGRGQVLVQGRRGGQAWLSKQLARQRRMRPEEHQAGPCPDASTSTACTFVVPDHPSRAEQDAGRHGRGLHHVW
jgi:hypothetical protein